MSSVGSGEKEGDVEELAPDEAGATAPAPEVVVEGEKVGEVGTPSAEEVETAIWKLASRVGRLTNLPGSGEGEGGVNPTALYLVFTACLNPQVRDILLFDREPSLDAEEGSRLLRTHGSSMTEEERVRVYLACARGLSIKTEEAFDMHVCNPPTTKRMRAFHKSLREGVAPKAAAEAAKAAAEVVVEIPLEPDYWERVALGAVESRMDAMKAKSRGRKRRERRRRRRKAAKQGAPPIPLRRRRRNRHQLIIDIGEFNNDPSNISTIRHYSNLRKADLEKLCAEPGGVDDWIGRRSRKEDGSSSASGDAVWMSRSGGTSSSTTEH